MSYFLKKTNRQNGVYLQIYESFHDPEKKYSRHKAVKTIGYVSKLQEQGIEDPIAYFTNEVNKMNQKRRSQIEEAKVQRIADDPVKNLGYFLAKGIINKLKIESEMAPYKLIHNSQYDMFQMLEALVYSRIVNPVSKLKTWQEIIPSLYGDYSFSLDQVYDACEFLGQEYERIIELFNCRIQKVYGRKTQKVYFDCTNYYFEIDYPCEDKQKGPSKENRKEPIISMALMLDENQIPLGMKMFPGNESEKPQLRNMVNDMKKRNCISGKTIQVADKGLNCGQNIAEALLNKDGYIFSKSVKSLPEMEKEWVLLDNDQWVDVKDKDGNLLYRYKECIDEFPYKFKDDSGVEHTVLLKEKRVATYNPSLAKKHLIEIDRMADKAAKMSLSQAKRGEYGETSKYLTFSSLDNSTGELCGEKSVKAIINTEKIESDKKLAGYNLLVSSEVHMPAKEIYSVYHNLWRIEESFRILKGQLDARPVYLKKKESIYGHFLICYLAVTILRILQIQEFKDELSCNTIITFIRNLQCVIDKKTVINIASLDKVAPIDDRLNLNLNHFYFSEKQLKNLMKFKF